MTKRIYYSKDFKYRALIEVASGKKLEDVLRENFFEIDDLIKKDKKYCAKLLYKWRKELCNNSQILNLKNIKTVDLITYELNNLESENETDVVITEAKRKISNGVNRYKVLKKYVISTYKK